ncbi:MAG: fibronectin type III domain-containing protein [Chloroflexi bacterium]|nr:fibronectin type III domain-containing protein [Chloroflexota bacterium]
MTPGNKSLLVEWNAPASDGGSEITKYQIGASTDGANFADQVDVAGSGRSATLDGLVNGTQYFVTLSAINAVGKGFVVVPKSASTTPIGTPSKPLFISATPTGTTTVSLVWTPPLDTGGAVVTIDFYKIRIVPVGGGAEVTSTTSASSTVVGGLVTGTTYRAEVSAVNNLNKEGPVGKSNTFVPAGVPDAPPTPIVREGDQRLLIEVAPPSTDGGSPLTYLRLVLLKAGVTTTDRLIAPSRKVVQEGGLENGTAYTIVLYAINDVGQSVSSSASGTPQAISPGRPTVVTALPRATGATSTTIGLLPASGGSFATTDAFVIRVIFANGTATTTTFSVTTTSAVIVPIPLTADGSTLVDGPATVVITALAGTVAAPPTVGVVFIDAIAPFPPFVLPISSLTTNSTVNLTIFAEPLSTVNVTGGFSAVSGQSRGFALLLTVPLKEGLNSLSLTSVDFAGNTSSATTISTTRDTIPPATPTFASAPPSTSTAASVNLKIAVSEAGTLRVTGGVTVVTSVVSGAGTVPIDVPIKLGTAATPIDNDLIITHRDAAGNLSGPLTATIASAPALGLEPPASPQVSIPASPTRELTVILRLRAEKAGQGYTITNKAAPTGSQNTSATSSGLIDLVAVNLVANATNVLDVVVSESGATSAVVTRTVVQDSTAPGAPTLGISGSTSTRATYFPLPVTGDAGNTINVVGGAFTVRVAASGVLQLVPVPLLENTSNSLFVTQTDLAGNESSPATITISRTETPTTIRGRVQAADLVGVTVTATNGAAVFTTGVDPFSGTFKLIVSGRSSQFTVQLTGIAGGTRWYNAGQPGSVSTSSVGATQVVPGKTGIYLRSMTAVNLPVISSVTSFATTNDKNSSMVLTGSNLSDIRGVFLVPTDRSREIRLRQITEISATSTNVQIPSGLPANTYNVVVVTRQGASAPSTGSLTLTQAIAVSPPPVVIRLSQVSLSEGTGPTVTLIGSNLGGALSVEIIGDPSGSILTPFNTSTAAIDVVVPATLDPGAYQFQVRDANGTGPLSPTIEVTVVVNPNTIEQDAVVTDGLDLGIATTSATRFILSSEGTEGDIADVVAFIEIPQGVTFEPEDGQQLPKNLAPPRQTEQPSDIPAGDATSISVGDPNQQINLSVPVVLQLVAEGDTIGSGTPAATRPFIYLETPGGSSPRELAGITGTHDGIAYIPGGVVLSETLLGNNRSEFTIGVLVRHFSDFTITSNVPVGAPTGVTATGGDTQIDVSWTASVANDDSVAIYTVKLFRDDDSNGASSSDTLIGSATTSSASSTFTFTDDNTSLSLLNGFDYVVEIFATGATLGDGPSGFSNTTSAAAAAGATISGVAGAVTLEGASVNTAAFTAIAPKVVVATCADAALGNYTLSATVDTVTGSFSLPNVPSGTVTLCAFAPGFVGAERTGVDTTAGDVTLSAAPVLKTGFVDSNTFINLTDILLTINEFGTSGATRPDGSGNYTDVDGDTFVNLTDILRVIGNFGQSGYQTWN